MSLSRFELMTSETPITTRPTLVGIPWHRQGKPPHIITVFSNTLSSSRTIRRRIQFITSERSMNTSTSEYSSGCESGWTIYFDQLSSYTDPYNRDYVTNCEAKHGYLNEDQDDEDLSMVSDASSGPPNLREPENEVHYYDYMPSGSEDKKKNKCKSKTKETFSKQQQQQQSLCLDDTASSTIFHFSQDNAPPYDDHDNVFSAADFQEESTTKKHFGFFISSSKQKSGSLLGRKWQ